MHIFHIFSPMIRSCRNGLRNAAGRHSGGTHPPGRYGHHHRLFADPSEQVQSDNGRQFVPGRHERRFRMQRICRHLFPSVRLSLHW